MTAVSAGTIENGRKKPHKLAQNCRAEGLRARLVYPSVDLYISVSQASRYGDIGVATNESTANDYERSPAKLESDAVNYAALLKFPAYRVIASRTGATMYVSVRFLPVRGNGIMSSRNNVDSSREIETVRVIRR